MITGRTSLLLQLDEGLLLWCRRLERPLLTRAMRGMTHLADASGFVAFAALLLAVGEHRAGVTLAYAAGLTAIVVGVLKRVCKRQRPDHALLGFCSLAENPDAFSFPSGHTATAFAVAVALTESGVPLAALGLFFASAVGTSRVYLGAHYPLDVVAGAGLGAAVGLLVRTLS
ncbi:MAG: phosphatase PAP2 family protein [Myxococcota bacterium]